jgi:uncharacterized protein (TIGR02271 family)
MDANQTPGNQQPDSPLVIPVIREQLSIDKEVRETGKVIVHKRVIEENHSVNIPLLQEGHTVERVKVDKVFNAPPPVRQEGDTVVIPVVREILIIEKKYEVTEELHVRKTRTETPYVQEITLLREEVHVERRNIDQSTPNNP